MLKSEGVILDRGQSSRRVFDGKLGVLDLIAIAHPAARTVGESDGSRVE